MSRDAADKNALPAPKVAKPATTTASKKVASPSAPKGAPAAARPALGWFERLRLRFQRGTATPLQRKEAPAKPGAAARRGRALADTSEAALLHRALKSVLDRHASSRSVLVHLGALEDALGRQGLKALDELPPEVTRRALTQLETLVADWSQAHLAALRARITAALVRHQHAGKHRSTAERLSDFQDSNRLQVNEGSVTTFMEVSAQWERSLPGSQRLDAPAR